MNSDSVQVPASPLASKLRALLGEYEDVFSEDLPREGARVAPMDLNLLPDAPPFLEGGRRRYAPMVWDKIHEEVAMLLSAGLIEEITDSEFISPVVMIKKPNSSDLRFCIDYKGVNKLLSVRPYLLPNIIDILDSCAGGKYFAHFDLSKGFWQFGLDPASRDISAFRVGNRIYQWTRVPMGISPAPFYLQKSMHTIFSDLLSSGVYIYLDYIEV